MGRKRGRNRNAGGNWGGNSQPWNAGEQSSPSHDIPLREFYRFNEHLGSESRGIEFKSWPGFIRNGFRENVAKYVCGFINSQENGKLLIGVDDKGHVTGYECSHHHEDSLRRDVDEAVKDLIPPLFPEDYSVRFVPVWDEHDQPIGNNYGKSKVIEVNVQGADIEIKDQLYQNKQGVFMRRDGSIQELKAHEIQEWTRRRYQGEIDKLRNNDKNIQSELHNKQNELRQMEEKLQQKNDELRRREMELERQKSTMGHMSEAKRQLQDENNQLKQRREPSGAEANHDVIERLDKMEQMLADNNKNKKSKVCAIS